MRVFLVSHFHWDREWYRTMQAFRARLVDAMDMVLDLAARDPDYRFLLDGQTVVLEDYLEIRPQREDELRRLVTDRRLGIGPWYVQPDSLLPSGEAHVRNLLLGREVGSRFAPPATEPGSGVSTVAYVPDSFGHPAEMPEIFRGFGLDGFVYWRGNGNEVDRLGPRWRWRAPSGATVRAVLLSEGYFNAGRPDDDVATAVERLAAVVAALAAAGEEPILLMNGFDHTRPDAHTAEIAGALAARLGVDVERALLDDVVAALPDGADLPVFEGDLIGARKANLLAGVWSSRMPLKIRNREIETVLQSWAEPWAAIGAALGLADERPALRLAWRSLVQNQAHDSICGCSIDATHQRMTARYDDAAGLAEETTARILERLAGRPADRSVPESAAQRLTVFNPSPRRRTDRVRVAIDGDPALAISLGEPRLHPLTLAALGEQGYTVDGAPARLLESSDPTRLRWLPDQRAVDVEFVATDLPPFGCRTYTLAPATPSPETVDDGRAIAAGSIAVEVADDGTIAVDFGKRRLGGLFALEDVGDRGDSYDHDPVGDALVPPLVALAVTRRRHASGIESLLIHRTVAVPAALDATRAARTAATETLDLFTELTVAPGVPRVDARLRLVNRASDHRLRLLLPTGAATGELSHASTFGVRRRSTAAADDRGWVHPAPSTFCHQGWIEANGITVVAPGLAEAAVTAAGAIAVTLVRAVGWLARFDLRTRPLPAGPAMAAPGAQTLGEIAADLSLLCDADAAAAAEATARLRAVIAGPHPIVADDEPMLAIEGDDVILSALKPADDGDGLVLRVVNLSDACRRVKIRFGLPVAAIEAARLDETPDPAPLEWDGKAVTSGNIAPRGILTIRARLRR